jgi:hypothetical protein
MGDDQMIEENFAVAVRRLGVQGRQLFLDQPDRVSAEDLFLGLRNRRPEIVALPSCHE